MPELVEVENYRNILLPLISQKGTLSVECPSATPPKVFPSSRQLDIVQRCVITSVERKGKIIRLHLRDSKKNDCYNNKEKKKKLGEFHLYMHMGMTGRISSPNLVPKLESLSQNDEYPPPHTHLILKMSEENNHDATDKHTDDGETSDGSNLSSHRSYEVAYSDPRRFGAVGFSCEDENLSSDSNGSSSCPLEKQWNEFAPDALDPSCSYDKLMNQKKGIKAILLDQKHVVSGVGNWIADEVLYQTKIHPDQSYLLRDEVSSIESTLKQILTKGIKCLKENKDFPVDWIFHSRWSKSKSPIKDYHGNIVSFVKSGGRTSAIVMKIQKKVKRQPVKNKNDAVVHDKSANSSKTRSKDKKEKDLHCEKKEDNVTSKKESKTYEKKRSITKSKDPDKIVKRRSQRIAKVQE